jgi:hypothetical protein
MALFGLLGKSKKGSGSDKQVLPVLPQEIYEAATLELQDILLHHQHYKLSQKHYI